MAPKWRGGGKKWDNWKSTPAAEKEKRGGLQREPIFGGTFVKRKTNVQIPGERRRKPRPAGKEVGCSREKGRPPFGKKRRQGFYLRGRDGGRRV